MTDMQWSQAAKFLLNNRKVSTKVERLAEGNRPSSHEDALAIHSYMAQNRQDGVGAWKCLLPPSEDKIIVAPIFTNTIHQGSRATLIPDQGKARIEPEIAFVLGEDLPARDTAYSNEEILDAITSTNMALELMQVRYPADSGAEFNEKLADCLSNQGLFIGPQIDSALAMQASEINISIQQTGKEQEFNGRHPNTFPQNPVFWLVNFMSQHGIDLKAGQAIITGSYCGIVDVDFDQSTNIEYKGLGSYEIQFEAIESN